MQVEVNGLELEVEVTGPDDGEPLLLIPGFGQQLTGWHPEVVRGLAATGHRVIAYDNRDVGLSEIMVLEVEPDVGAVLGGDHATLAYTLDDLASDAVGVLDALGLHSAHVLGHSMGGAVAQLVAAGHGPRVRTLTLWGASPGDGSGPMDEEVLAVLVAPMSDDREANIERSAAVTRLASDPYPVGEEEALERGARLVDRWVSPTTGGRQLAAMLADGDRTSRLERIEAPTLVVHGVGDRFIGVSGGRSLAGRITDATLVEIEGMGHAPYAPEHIESLVTAVATHTGVGS